jgi:hypothetical protein
MVILSLITVGREIHTLGNQVCPYRFLATIFDLSD